MSKAFTRESDDSPERPLTNHRAALLPPGEKNYLTAQGAHKLQDTLHELMSQPVSSSTRQRIFEIRQSLQSAVVVEPPPPPWKQVFFGATVTVRDQTGESITYRIVGADETNMGENQISWRSPLAKSLLNACLGDHIHFHAPAGQQKLEIMNISYQSS